MAYKRYIPEDPQCCEECGEQLEKGSNQTWKMYRNRRFCSRKCSAQNERRLLLEKIPEKFCRACGEKLVIREKEPVSQFRRRVTCNRVCGGGLKKTDAGRPKPKEAPATTTKHVYVPGVLPKLLPLEETVFDGLKPKEALAKCVQDYHPDFAEVILNVLEGRLENCSYDETSWQDFYKWGGKSL